MGLDMYLYKAHNKFVREDGTIPDIMIELYDYCIFTKEFRHHLNKTDLKLLDTIIEIIEKEYPVIKEIQFNDEVTPIFAIIEELAYWRKAYAIDEWFVRNIGPQVRDRQSYYRVTKEQLEELLETCRRVKENPELAPELLPLPDDIDERTSSLGPKQYDDWYFDWIDYTVEKIPEILNSVDFNEYCVVYYASE